MGLRCRISRTNLVRVLLACGVAYSLLYVVENDVIAATRYEGYSRMSQAISELSAKGGPDQKVPGGDAPSLGSADDRVPTQRADELDHLWPAHAEYVPMQIAAMGGHKRRPTSEADAPQRLVAYKTAALPAELHRRETLSVVADRPPSRENRWFTCGFSHAWVAPSMTGTTLSYPAGTGKHRQITAAPNTCRRRGFQGLTSRTIATGCARA